MKKCLECKKYKIALVVTLAAFCVSTFLYVQARRRRGEGQQIYYVANR